MIKMKRLLLEDTREELASKLEKAFKAGPAATRMFLDSPEGSSEIVRKDILLSPDQDGQDPDDKVAVGAASGPASAYLPTQSEIDLMKSVSYPLGSVKTFADAVRKPMAGGIVTSNNLVIDGHHRWSGAISIGGDDAQVSGKNVKWPGTNTAEKLAAAQLAIAAKLGPGKKTPTQSKGFKTNIMGKGAGAIAKMIMANINKQTDAGAPGPLLNDDMMNTIANTQDKDNADIMKWLGSAGDRISQSENKVRALRIAIATKVGQNLAELPANPEAPARKDMPQFDDKVGGPDLDSVTPELTGKAGGYNVSPPFVKDGIIKLKDLMK
tara:strand:- start:863 stop:1834 length:972 start_codon:yes stop_codon:yes gene_type:complete